MRQRRIASALLIVASFCLVVAQVHADEYLERMMHSIFDGLTSPSPEISTMTSTTTTTTTTTTPTPTPTTTTTTTTTTPTTTTMPTTTTTTENNVRDGIGYECVPHYLCQNGTITTNGAFVIESRFGGSCKFGEVLCAIPTTVKPEMKKMSIEKPPNEKRRRLVNRCGIRHRKGVGYRISSTSENQTEFGEFPWMVVIFRRSEDENNLTKYYACGGSIIHPQVVLTAAHCVQGAKQFKVRAGEWDTETDEELLPHQDRTVSEIVIHPDFYRPTLHYDFAIVFLSSPFEYADNVDIVCLPDRDDRFDGDRCSVTGWGKKSHVVERNYQNILKKVDLPVVPRNDCQTRLRKTRVGRYYILDKSFMCAGGEVGNDACKGDGGSPLVCPTGPRGTRYVQAGIVAGGIDCGTAGVPGLYGNVAFARDWIDGHMAAHNLDINVYRVPRII